MKTLIRIAILATLPLLLIAVAYAQDRQVELNAELPAKRGLVTSDIVLAGRVYLPMSGRFTVVADLSFRDAINLFLAPTDQISAEGQVWYYLASPEASSVRPFVFGGLTRSLFVGQPDATNGLAGFGVTIRKPSGFHVIPTFEFASDGFESDRVTLGRAYNAKVYIHIPLGQQFNLNLTPRFARADHYQVGAYRSEYSLSVGFSRKF